MVMEEGLGYNYYYLLSNYCCCYFIGSSSTTDVSASEDSRVTTSLLLEIQNKHPEWRDNNNNKIAMTYDGRSSVFASSKLPFTLKNEKGDFFISETISLFDIKGTLLLLSLLLLLLLLLFVVVVFINCYCYCYYYYYYIVTSLSYSILIYDD